MEGVPHALSEHHGGGLDDTRNWGTIYWGGALFCLLADVQIRQATDNEKGLQDALRYLVSQGNVIITGGDAPVLFQQADEALGITVLSDLYRRFKAAPYQVEPAFLWRRLGVSMTPAGKVVYDDDAEWAHLRRAIIHS
jgi:predicted metalloprotease with PDZ domain